MADAPPSIVCFRYAPPGLRAQEDRLDAINKTTMEHIQCNGEAFLSGTTIRGRFAMRACALHSETTSADVDALLEIARRVGLSVTATRPEGGHAR